MPAVVTASAEEEKEEAKEVAEGVNAVANDEEAGEGNISMTVFYAAGLSAT